MDKDWRTVKVLQALQRLVGSGMDHVEALGTVRQLKAAAVQLHRRLQEIVGYSPHMRNPYVEQLVLGYNAQVREVLAGLPELSVLNAVVFACPNSRLEALSAIAATIKGLQAAVMRLNEAIKENEMMMAKGKDEDGKMDKEVKKPTFLDRRFSDFSRAVLQAAREGRETVHLFGRDVNFSLDNKDLEHLLEVKIGGKQYSLVDNLESKASLAADGFLGPELIEGGIRNLARVMERKKRTKAAKAFKELKKLWGEHAKIAWSLKNGIVHSERIARITLSVVKASVAAGHVPTDMSEVRSMGLRLPFIASDEWPFIRAFAGRILARQSAQPAQPEQKNPQAE